MNQSIAPSKCEVLRGKMLALLQIFVLGLPSLLLSVVSSIFCCCCLSLCGDTAPERFTNCMSFWGNVLTVLVAIPFFVLLLLFVPLWCVLYVAYLSLVGAAGEAPDFSDIERGGG